MRDDALTVTAIRADGVTPALREEWDRLWIRCPNATVFQTCDWICAAHDLFESGTPSLVLCVRAQDELVAIAALRLIEKSWRFQGLEVSDYQDVLALPAARVSAASKVVEFLTSDLGQSCDFDRVECTSPLHQVAPPPGVRVLSRAGDVCPVLSLGVDSHELEQIVPSGFCRRIRQAQRVARSAFRVEFVVAAPDSAADHLETLFELHASRWNARGESGVLHTVRLRQFHHRVAPSLVARGFEWLIQLTFDGVPVAAIMAFWCHGRVCYYIGGFAPDYARFSPGRLIIAELVERALRIGAREVDFLRGVEPYKYDWGAANRSTLRVRFERSTVALGKEEALRAMRSCDGMHRDFR